MTGRGLRGLGGRSPRVRHVSGGHLGRARRGVTMILILFVTVVMMAFAAMAVDVSRMYAVRSELQRSADAAAHAGALRLIRAAYNTADAEATTIAGANQVQGASPTVRSIEYGSWDPASSTFTTQCVAPCTAAAAAGATALRVTLTGGSTAPIFAQFVGGGGFTITVSAVAWIAPTIAQHDCSKPFSLRYESLTDLLASFEGRTADSERTLDSTDVATIRANGPQLAACFTINPTDRCAPTAPPATYAGTYQDAQLYPPATEGTDPFLTEIEEPCASSETLGPGDVLELDPPATVKPGDTNGGTDAWCTLYAPYPCAMKLALWDSAAPPGAVASDGNTCGAGTCVRVRAVVPFIVTAVTEGGGNVNAAIQAYPTLAIDEAPVGPPPAGPLARVVLVR